MEFGLLPKFSTPVQKAVENTGLLQLIEQNRLILLHFCEAKVCQAIDFEHWGSFFGILTSSIPPA
jgi:hypothetical protein